MKICLYGYSLVNIGGGTAQYTRALGSELMKEGHEVTVVTRRWSQAEILTEGLAYHFITIDSHPAQASGNIRYALKSILYFLRHGDEFDLIHCISGFQSFAILAAFIKKSMRLPMVYSILSPFQDRFYLRAFDQLVCTSRNIEQKLNISNVIYIPPFISTEHFRSPSRYDFGANSDFVIGTMGYPISRKGNRFFVEAIPMILKRFPKTLFVLALDLPMISYMEDLQTEKKYIEQLIVRAQIQEKVKILGAIDVPRFLNSLDIFVYPVQTTAGMIDIPPTVLECLAAGCGLVTSRKGGIVEVVKDGYNGVLVPEGAHNNPRAYADRIIDLMEHRDLLENLRQNGPESVRGFDVKIVVPEIVKLYEGILGAREIGLSDHEDSLGRDRQ
jgi:glycosyltransferase involved in cell wall biosynthesis